MDFDDLFNTNQKLLFSKVEMTIAEWQFADTSERVCVFSQKISFSNPQLSEC